MQRKNSQRRGVSLVELLLFIGILAIMAGAITSFSLFSRRLGTHNELVAEVEQNGALVTERITQEVQNADIIAYPGAGGIGESLVLVTLTPYREVAFQLFHDRLRIVESDANTITFLTTLEVGVDQLSFLHTSGATPEEASLSFAFRVYNKVIGIDAAEGQYQRQFRSTVALRPSNRCATNADCTTAPYNTCCSGVCRQACFTGCTSDSQCNTAAGQICCVTNLAAGTKSCTTLAGCSLQCQIVDDCPVDSLFCAAGCEQRMPTCTAGRCASLYAGPCGDCSWCGDGFIDEDGIDEEPGRAGVDDDGDGTMDTSGELLSVGSDDEECDDGCILLGDPPGCDDGPPYIDTNTCTNACRINTCGDGVISMGVEECDDGNMLPGDGCDLQCKTEIVCGNAKLSVAFVVDTSSAELKGTKEALKKFLTSMDFPKDEAMIIMVGSTATVIQALSSNEAQLKSAVETLGSGGGNIQHGLELARQGLSAASAYVKIVILLSDGGVNRKTAAGTSCTFTPPPDDDCGAIAEATSVKTSARLFTIDVSNDASTDLLLREVSSDPDSTYAMGASSADGILDAFAAISDAVCICGSTTVCSGSAQCVSVCWESGCCAWRSAPAGRPLPRKTPATTGKT